MNSPEGRGRAGKPSAISFAGWQQGSFRVPEDYTPLPVAAARTALLAEDWMAYGLIDTWERPGPI